jgi:Protein of unknown function (DUF2380)
MRSGLAGICWLAVLACAAPVGATERIALFDFELINTSLEPTRPDEEARLAMMSELLRAEFARRPEFEVLDIAALAEEVEAIYLQGCNSCELKLAQRLDANLAGIGWVQKVSKSLSTRN